MNDEGFAWFLIVRIQGIGEKFLYFLAQLQEQGRWKPPKLQSEETIRVWIQDFCEAWQNLRSHIESASYRRGWRSVWEVVKNGAASVERIQAFYDEYRYLYDRGIVFVYPGHRWYPRQLFLGGSAPVLWAQGYLPLLQAPSVAIVGSRSASSGALQMAYNFAAELAGQGWNVISGYARGVDTQAHLGALEAGGTTTMVLSLGMLNFTRKRALAKYWDKDRTNVLVLSQFAPQEPWRAQNAMRRNGVVSLLAKAMVVVESGAHKDSNGRYSGTFQAASFALQQRIPVFVVSPSCFTGKIPEGNQQLISKGAIEFSPAEFPTIISSLSSRSVERREVAQRRITGLKEVQQEKRSGNSNTQSILPPQSHPVQSLQPRQQYEDPPQQLPIDF